MNGSRVLVTGASGFLGSHLCEALLKQGCTVIGVDNFCTGVRENLNGLTGQGSSFTFLEQDICEPFDPGPVDYVFNMASPASPPDYLRLGLETLRVGSYGVMNVLEIARKYKAKILQASTSECYGDPLEHPQKESYWGNVNPIGPRSVYDESKRFAEASVSAYSRYFDVDVRIVRIFNTYGPRLKPNDGRVISSLMMQALRGDKLTIFGDGTQTRSFCYVTDLIAGILLLAQSKERLPVNLGNPEEWTILECAKTILDLTGSKSQICFAELPQDDPVRRKPDITRARQLLGWEPKIALREGLERSLGYFKDRIRSESFSAGD